MIPGRFKGRIATDYTGKTWGSITYKRASKSKGKNKVYAIKASAARDGVTMADAVAALGPPPEGMKVSGYNPNLVRTDKALAKDLGMNVKKEEATLNALAAEKKANALTNMTATPVEYAKNALISSAPAMDPMFDPSKQKTAGIAELLKPTPTRSLQATYSTPTTEANVAGPGDSLAKVC